MNRILSSTMSGLLAALLIYWFAPMSAAAQEISSETERAQLVQIITFLQQNLGELEETTNNPVHQAYRRALIADYERQIAARSQIVRTFDWSYWASWVSLGLVVIIVISGIVFCGYQLRIAARLGAEYKMDSTLEVEQTGKLKFQSSVVGITVLVISLAFFYLFLNHVFNIRVIDVRVPTSSQTTAPSPGLNSASNTE